MFTLHGLWPNYPNRGYPAFCDKSAKFDPAKVDDLKDDLERNWMSYSSSNSKFWKHEWEKHGTCASPVITDEHQYFQEGLRLHKELDIMGALAKHGITPSNDPAGYKSADLVAALQQELGAAPVLKCTNGGLVEVWLCINRDLKVFECPTGYPYTSGAKSTRTLLGEETCKSTLTLPPLNPQRQEDRKKAHKMRQGAARAALDQGRQRREAAIKNDAVNVWAYEDPGPGAFLEV